MERSSAQLGLFGSNQIVTSEQEAHARARMHTMIDGLRTTSVPPWKDEMGAILRDGEFQRAMRLVPAGEARALWVEFDAHMERLYAIWLETADVEAG